MNKTEMLKHFKPGNMEASQEYAQMLADQTAAELEELATSMHAMAEQLTEALMRTGRGALESSKIAQEAAATAKRSGELAQLSANALDRVIDRQEMRRAGQFRQLLLVAALCAAVGSVSATLLLRFWPDLMSSKSQSTRQVTINTPQLARELTLELMKLRDANANRQR